jgi:hypothetical protein
MYTNDNVLLITKDHLFKYTQLQGNVDIDKVTPFVKIAQDIQVQEILRNKVVSQNINRRTSGHFSG